MKRFFSLASALLLLSSVSLLVNATLEGPGRFVDFEEVPTVGLDSLVNLDTVTHDIFRVVQKNEPLKLSVQVAMTNVRDTTNVKAVLYESNFVSGNYWIPVDTLTFAPTPDAGTTSNQKTAFLDVTARRYKVVYTTTNDLGRTDVKTAFLFWRQ